MPAPLSLPVRRRYPPAPLLGVATAVWRDDTVLLVKRAVAPNAGTWAMPGGLVELGERLEEAARREVLEETTVRPGPLRFMRFHEIILRDGDGGVERHFVLAFFAARWADGEARAGDDAADARWCDEAALETLPLTGNTRALVRKSRLLLAPTAGQAD